MAKRSLPKPADPVKVKAATEQKELQDQAVRKGWIDDEGKFHAEWCVPENPQVWSDEA